MRYLILFSSLLQVLCLHKVLAQDLTLHTGVSFVSMSDMKSLRQQKLSDFNVDFKVTDDFPAYWQHGFSATWLINPKFRTGFQLYTTSTGGRATYADYSGKVVFDQSLKFVGLLLQGEYVLTKDRRYEIAGYTAVGQGVSWLETYYFEMIAENVKQERESYRSGNRVGELGFVAKYFLNDLLFISTRCGFQLNIPGKLIDSNGNSLYVYSNEATANWTGLKINAGVGIRLDNKKKGS